MNQPLLHVMIPAFGKSPYLRQTLESAVKYLPVEVPITVIEDPSPDANLESLVKEFPRVQYVKNSQRLAYLTDHLFCQNTPQFMLTRWKTYI